MPHGLGFLLMHGSGVRWPLVDIRTGRSDTSFWWMDFIGHLALGFFLNVFDNFEGWLICSLWGSFPNTVFALEDATKYKSWYRFLAHK